jgi:HD superfamily phosphohydrolase
MNYDDELYGRVEITEPVLLDLITSEAMRRTKGISQHGITALLGITPPFSRFDHSLGAMLLVRRLGASVKEQIAALLHDISHTAFSHVIDFVFDDHGSQSYHEEKKEEIVAKSDIPGILEQHGIDWREVMDEDKFSLLEQSSPALCADRLDYFLRDLEFLQLATRSEIRASLEFLRVVDQQIAIADADAARWLAYTFIETDRTSWSSFREVGLYQLTAEAIKAAERHRFIEEADLWGSDEALWRKLQSANHPEIASLVKLISPGTRFIWSEEQAVFRVATKVRSIDPPVTIGSSVTLLSLLDHAFAQYRDEYLSSKRGQWPMAIINPPNVRA